MSTLRPCIRALLLALVGISLCAEDFDFIIRNGSVVDGSGKPAFAAAVAVKDGKIAAVGNVTGSSKREIDATGCVVAPGFIDVHTHAEGIVASPQAENFLRMGVTTVIVGNCGASETNVADFFDELTKTKVSANVATLIGHNSIRRAVMGSTQRAPTADELAGMKQAVGQAMKDGAVGLSTGLIYAPGKYSDTAEIIQLAKVAAQQGGLYATHVRDEQEGFLDSLHEAFRVGREAGLPVEISHLKLSGNLISPQKSETVKFLEQARRDGFVEKVIAALKEASDSGLKVSQDLYPYSAATASLTRLLPSAAREGVAADIHTRLKDPAQRAAIATKMKDELLASGHNNYAHIVIVTARRFKGLQGLNIAQAAKQRWSNDSVDSQIQTILDLAPADVSVILYDGNEPDMTPLMKLPQTMFISDSGTFQFGNETQHPRGYGSAARVLGRYVRDEHLLTMEDAVHKMTGLCATTFKLKDRGELRPGAWADIVIFDPAKVQDNATYADPHVPATGFNHVFVNGIETVTNDRHTGARAGQALRRAM